MDGLEVILYWFALSAVAGVSLMPGMPTGYGVIAAALVVAAPILLLATPHAAPWIVFGVAAAILVVPLVLGGLAVAQSNRENTRTAWLLSLAATGLHPFDHLPDTTRLLRALDLRARGRIDAARHQLARLSTRDTPTGLLARLQLCERRDDFRAMEADPRLARGDIASTTARLRVLGETGRIAEMVDLHRTILARAPTLQIAQDAPRLLVTLTFAGRPRGVAALHRGPLAMVPAESRAWRIARAGVAAGGTERVAAERELARLRESARAQVRRNAARCLDDPPAAAGPLGSAGAAFLDRIEAALEVMRPRRAWWRSWATLGLILANGAMFLVEARKGGTSDPDTLYALGGLSTPDFVWPGDAWRLLAAMFLHAGPIHIAMNMLALLVYGIIVERMVGGWRLLALYLGSGLAASAAAIPLERYDLVRPELIVGASGAILGLVGALAGSALRELFATRDPAFARRFLALVLLLALQTAIDLTIPQVSVATHLAGAGAGFVLGLVPRFRWPAAAPLAGVAEPLAPAAVTQADPALRAAARLRAILIGLATLSIASSLAIAAFRP